MCLFRVGIIPKSSFEQSTQASQQQYVKIDEVIMNMVLATDPLHMLHKSNEVSHRGMVKLYGSSGAVIPLYRDDKGEGLLPSWDISMQVSYRFD